MSDITLTEYKDKVSKIKEKIFKLLLSIGEPLNKDEKEEYIISGGIKFSRQYNNKKYYYNIEECNGYDDYYHIHNLFILNLIKNRIEDYIATTTNLKRSPKDVFDLTYKTIER